MRLESLSNKELDLRGTPCPVNFIRSKLILEDLKSNDLIHIDLDSGEPEEMVIAGLQNEGHIVQIIHEDIKIVISIEVCIYFLCINIIVDADKKRNNAINKNMPLPKDIAAKIIARGIIVNLNKITL